MKYFKKRPYSRPRKTSSKKKSARGGRKSSVVSSAVKTYLKSTIHKQLENKGVQVQAATNFGNVTHDATLGMYPVTPYGGYITISQGVTSSTRTGNKVNVRKVMLKYVLYPNQYSAVSNVTPRPCEVQMWLGYVKNASGFIPSALDIDNLFQYNNSDTLPLGSVMDLNQQINTDYWCIKKYWTHKVGFSSANGTGGNIGYQYYNNNDFKLNVVRKLDITKHYPKILTFNDNSPPVQGAGLFFFFQAVAADGSTFSSSQTPMAMQWEVDIDYEDA